MYSPLQIANYFIRKSFESGKEITPLKLIKMVYIAHGWYLAIFDEPLLTEGVQAWKHGPVIKSVYDKFKHFGKSSIDSLYYTASDGNIVVPNVEDEIDIEFLEKIWSEYSDLGAYTLANLTHQEGTPWDIVWNKMGGKNKMEAIIPNDLIEDHYREKKNVIQRRREEAEAV